MFSTVQGKPKIVRKENKQMIDIRIHKRPAGAFRVVIKHNGSLGLPSRTEEVKNRAELAMVVGEEALKGEARRDAIKAAKRG